MATSFSVELSTLEALRLAQDEQLSQGGLYIETTERPALFAQVELHVGLPDSTLTASAQVVNITSTGLYILFEPNTLSTVKQAVSESIEALEAQGTMEDAEHEPGPEEAPEPESRETPERGGPLRGKMTPVWELIDSASDVPVHRQVSKLSVNDKLRLARQANRPVRRILIRDVEKRIHLEVIKNPQVQDDELLEYASISGISPTALEWMARQSRLIKNKRMVMKLVTNTATPPRTAKKLLDKLTNRELVRVVRSPRAREALVREARRRLMKAGIL